MSNRPAGSFVFVTKLFLSTVASAFGMVHAGTFEVLSEAHGGSDRLALATGLLLHHVVVAGNVIRAHLFLLPLLLLSGRELLGEGEHGEDHQQHGHGTEQEPTPPKEGSSLMHAHKQPAPPGGMCSLTHTQAHA